MGWVFGWVLGWVGVGLLGVKFDDPVINELYIFKNMTFIDNL